jgi:hypothetical protein
MNAEFDRKTRSWAGRRDSRPAFSAPMLAGAILLTAALASGSAAAARAGSDRDYPVRKEEEIRKTLKFADVSRPGEVVVDNIFGPVTVEGYDGKDVVLVARKTIHAKDADAVAKAEAEVKLDIAEEGRTVDIYVDGPFRDHEGSRRRFRSWREPGYEVHYAFQVKVPFRTDLAVSTVTGGDVEVRNVEGEFDVHNVNGKVRMSGIAGSGEAATVNGELAVGFRRAPAGACGFKTVNGDVVVTLPPDASADFRLKTFHGEAYSDFAVTSLPPRPAVREEKKGTFVFKSDRSVGVRVGQGGFEIALDTLNGDILIKKKSSQ